MNVTTVGQNLNHKLFPPAYVPFSRGPRGRAPMCTRHRLAVAFTAVALAVTGFSLTTLLADAPAATRSVTTQPTATQPASQPTTKPKPKPLDEEGTLNFLKTNEPEVYKDALVIREKDNKKFQDLLTKEFMPAVKHLLDIQGRDPEMFRVTMEDRRLAYHASQLARELRDDTTMKPQDRAEKKEELTAVVAQQFAARQKMRQLDLDAQQKRLAELQKTLDNLKQGLDDREKNKVDLINARINDLMKKNPKVEW